MKNSKQASDYVRPMLEAMARSIEAARMKRTSAGSQSWTGSREGTTPYSPHFKIGNTVADNGKTKAKPNSSASSFFRDRDDYRKAG